MELSSTSRATRPFFFFNDTATTEIYTLSLHDALPISASRRTSGRGPARSGPAARDRPVGECGGLPWGANLGICDRPATHGNLQTPHVPRGAGVSGRALGAHGHSQSPLGLPGPALRDPDPRGAGGPGGQAPRGRAGARRPPHSSCTGGARLHRRRKRRRGGRVDRLAASRAAGAPDRATVRAARLAGGPPSRPRRYAHLAPLPPV